MTKSHERVAQKPMLFTTVAPILLLPLTPLVAWEFFRPSHRKGENMSLVYG